MKIDQNTAEIQNFKKNLDIFAEFVNADHILILTPGDFLLCFLWTSRGYLLKL